MCDGDDLNSLEIQTMEYHPIAKSSHIDPSEIADFDRMRIRIVTDPSDGAFDGLGESIGSIEVRCGKPIRSRLKFIHRQADENER